MLSSYSSERRGLREAGQGGIALLAVRFRIISFNLRRSRSYADAFVALTQMPLNTMRAL